MRQFDAFLEHRQTNKHRANVLQCDWRLGTINGCRHILDTKCGVLGCGTATLDAMQPTTLLLSEGQGRGAYGEHTIVRLRPALALGISKKRERTRPLACVLQHHRRKLHVSQTKTTRLKAWKAKLRRDARHTLQMVERKKLSRTTYTFF